MKMMKAAVFTKPGSIVLEDKPVPQVGPGDALVRITTTTICGTDIHILKGEYPVRPGLIIGHEPVGVIEDLGEGVIGYQHGQRVIVGAITPCGQCYHCMDGHQSQCGGQPIGGWQFGNSIDGCQAEFLLVPNAQANLSPIPDGLTDEQVLMCPGGKERMRRLLNVVASGRVDLEPLVTHRFKLDDIEDAYELFANQRDGVLKIAITP